jgi:hypothetical protein
MKMANDYCFEAQGTGSPITLLQGPKTSAAIEKAAELTAYHSDKKQKELSVRFGRGGFNKSLRTPIPNEKEVEDVRVTSQKAPAQFRTRKNWDESEKLEK